MIKHVLAVFLAGVACFPAMAGPDVKLSKEFDTCMDNSGGVTVKMLDCIATETKLQDQRLNKNYKDLMAQLTEKRKKELLEVQYAWLKFRDLNCEYYAEPDGGTSAGVARADCILTMTALRANELHDLMPPD